MNQVDEDPGLRSQVNAYLRSAPLPNKVLAIYPKLDRSSGLKYFECTSVASGCKSSLPLVSISGLDVESANSLVPLVDPTEPMRCKEFGEEVPKPTDINLYLYPSQANINETNGTCSPGYLPMYDVAKGEDGSNVYLSHCVAPEDIPKCTTNMGTQKLGAVFDAGDWCLTHSLRKRGYTKQCPNSVRQPCNPKTGNLTCDSTPAAGAQTAQGWEHTLTQSDCSPPSAPTQSSNKSSVSLDYEAPVSVDVKNS